MPIYTFILRLYHNNMLNYIPLSTIHLRFFYNKSNIVRLYDYIIVFIVLF